MPSLSQSGWHESGTPSWLQSASPAAISIVSMMPFPLQSPPQSAEKLLVGCAGCASENKPDSQLVLVPELEQKYE